LNYQATDKLSTIIGLRVDNHNNFGFFVTPRLNVKYAFGEKSVLRISAARAQKTASIFSENIGLLASSRSVLIESNNNANPYSLDAEVAWNYGINYSKGFESFSFNLDYYFTNFENQVVVDLDQNTREINFYNLQKNSFSHSFLAQIDWAVFDNFDLRLAYRFNDVQIDYKSGRMQKYLMSKNRAFLNAAYEISDSWKFDYTLNWFGEKRIPNTLSNPSNYQLEKWSPSFFTMNAQVNKLFLNNDLDVYIGVENLLNFTQDNPIIAADSPNSQFFDASLVWGPVFGRNIYFGIKYKI
jgi:outer membrane receptor for ferrienterochelin and colicin